MPARRPRIAVLDIETAPLLSYHWKLWKENIGLDQIVSDWSILSFAFKWLGEKRVYFYSTGGRGEKRVRDDKAVCQKLRDVLDEADIVVTQNGKKFDIKKINTRLIIHNFRPYSPIKVVDTREIAKKHFGFASNRLQHLTDHLTAIKKDKHKQFPGFELWAECLKDNPKAWAEMEKYNKIDVLSDEQVYLRFLPWVEGHPNMASYSEMEEPACPKCGSHDVQKRGRALTQSGEYHRYQCQDCGGWSRSRYTLNSTAKRRSLLIN